MYVFIDDSGDPAFKLAQGSTSHFVIACVVFTGSNSAEVASSSIKDFKTNSGISINQELKFNKTRFDLQKEFFKHIQNLDFFVRAVVIDKRDIHSQYFINNTKSMYNYAIKEVLSKSAHLLIDAKVKIDGSAGREARQALAAYIKNQVNNAEVKSVLKVKHVDSKSDNLIQLADMVAGAIRRSHEGDKTDKYKLMLYPIISKENSDIWIFK